MDLAGYALEAFREAARLGFPVRAKRLLPDVVLVENKRGKGVVFLGRVEDDGFFYVVGGAEKYMVFSVKLAKVENGGRLLEVYPVNVPSVVAQHVRLLSTFEADVWTARLRGLLGSRRPVPLEEAPGEARLLAERLGGRVVYVGETGEYAVEVGGVVVAWFNPALGRLEDVSRYSLEAAGGSRVAGGGTP